MYISKSEVLAECQRSISYGEYLTIGLLIKNMCFKNIQRSNSLHNALRQLVIEDKLTLNVDGSLVLKSKDFTMHDYIISIIRAMKRNSQLCTLIDIQVEMEYENKQIDVEEIVSELIMNKRVIMKKGMFSSGFSDYQYFEVVGD